MVHGSEIIKFNQFFIHFKIIRLIQLIHYIFIDMFYILKKIPNSRKLEVLELRIKNSY